MNVAAGETPIFDELREALGMIELEELIGHPELNANGGPLEDQD